MTNRSRWAPAIVALSGIGFLLIYPLMKVWPAGWQWHPPQPAYEQMIIGVYATLGVFMLRAARDPLANASLIWFAVWSSAVHATIMLVHAFTDPGERGHIVGDVATLYVIAILLAAVMPRSGAATAGATPSQRDSSAG